MTTFRKLQKFA